MGYNIEAAEGKVRFDQVTLTGMDRIIEAAERSGVELDVVRLRRWGGRPGDERNRGEYKNPVKVTLREAFGTNDGWWITPGECRKLAEKLPDAAPDSGDPAFVRKAAKFFARAAEAGGCYVW